MSKRRAALPVAILLALATVPVLNGAAPAAASTGWSSEPTRRSGERPGNPGDDEASKDDCPTEFWTIPLELKNVACVLLLAQGDDSDSDSGDSTMSSTDTRSTVSNSQKPRMGTDRATP
jgi:hypothetical protein